MEGCGLRLGVEKLERGHNAGGKLREVGVGLLETWWYGCL